MFSWIKNLDDLLGFNPWKFLVVCCIVTGLSFPFVFLNADMSDIRETGFIASIFGLTYATILTFGNAYIWYRGKLNTRNKKIANRNRILNSGLLHFVFTVLCATALGFLGILSMNGNAALAYIVRNIIGSILFSGIIVIIIESLYYMHQLRMSEKREEILMRQNAESQLEILKNQVKPHFLFNSLNTVISIIPDEPEAAIDYIQRLSKVYRYILEIKDKKLIPLNDELDCIKDYMHMLQTRFGENLQFELKDENISDDKHVVPLSLQLLIENAVKHNIISNKKPLKINIHKGKNGGLLVSNNLQPKIQKMPSTGTGLANIKDRYEMLTDQQVDVIQTQEQFTVSIPLIEVA